MRKDFRQGPHMKPLLSALLILLSTVPGLAQESTSRAAQILDNMPRAKRISEVAISPDGTHIAYIIAAKLTVLPIRDETRPTPISVDNDAPVREVSWSWDSKRVAFLADLPGDKPSAQLWTSNVDGSNATK